MTENRKPRVVCPESDYDELGFQADFPPKFNVILRPSKFGVKREASESPYLTVFKKFLAGEFLILSFKFLNIKIFKEG